MAMKGAVARDILGPVLTPIHREGYVFIALFALVTAILGLVWSPFWGVGTVLTAWCAFFFRDPKRVTPVWEAVLLSPADGLVQSIVAAPPPAEAGLGEVPLTRISVFMNVFNVHVNRIPADGAITSVFYRPGRFFNASLDKASVGNERMTLVMEAFGGQRIVFVQIAGLIARRILCQVEPGDAVRAGQRFGLIRFGSRVDIYLPRGVAPLVCQGQTMVAGETVLADLSAIDPDVDRPQKFRGESR